MGRWKNAWWELMRAYRDDQVSQAQFRAIIDRHRALPANEETLQMLLSATAAAKDEYAKASAVEPGPGTEAATHGPAPGPASLETS